jgi:hypothetical protein
MAIILMNSGPASGGVAHRQARNLALSMRKI